MDSAYLGKHWSSYVFLLLQNPQNAGKMFFPLSTEDTLLFPLMLFLVGSTQDGPCFFSISENRPSSVTEACIKTDEALFSFGYFFVPIPPLLMAAVFWDKLTEGQAGPRSRTKSLRLWLPQNDFMIVLSMFSWCMFITKIQVGNV